MTRRPDADAPILDIGCGSGTVGGALAALGAGNGGGTADARALIAVFRRI